MCLLWSRHSRAFSAASHFLPQATGWPHLSSREEPPEPRSHTNPTGPTQSQKSSTSKQVEEFLPLPNPALGSQTAPFSQLMHSVVYAKWEKSTKWIIIKYAYTDHQTLALSSIKPASSMDLQSRWWPKQKPSNGWKQSVKSDNHLFEVKRGRL